MSVSGTGSRAGGRARPATLVTGFACLANGAALTLHVVGRLSLPLLLAAIWTVAVISIGAMAVVSSAGERASMLRVVTVGLVVGIAATIAYDATKAVLSQLDPSPYNPFEATRMFGRALVGDAAGSTAIAAAGWAFHLANGSTFAVAYAGLFARDGNVSRRLGLATGIAWALMLETFQLVLYPGWMDIRFLDEFRQISFASHLVFGLALGLLIPAGLRWARRRSSRLEGRPVNG